MAELAEALRPEWWETEEGRAATEVSRVQLSRLLHALRRCVKLCGSEVAQEIVMLRINEGFLELDSLQREMERLRLSITAHRYLTRGEFRQVIASERLMRFQASQLAQKRLRQFHLARHTQKRIEKKLREAQVRRARVVLRKDGQPDRRLENRGRPKKIPFP